MRSFTGFCLLAFACGVSALQTCAALPPHPFVGMLAAAAAGPVRPAWRVASLRTRTAVGVLAFALLGFGYAAWRAEVRLADALPREWEGEDLRLVGVVDDLPAASARGVRFAFAVERGAYAGRARAARESRSRGTLRDPTTRVTTTRSTPRCQRRRALATRPCA